MRLLYWFVTLFILLVVIVFAWSNRAEVVLSFWPFFVDWQLPLYLVVLVTTAIGFLFGEFVAWVNGGRWRRRARERARRIEALERELAATQAQLASSSAPAPPAPLRLRQD